MSLAQEKDRLFNDLKDILPGIYAVLNVMNAPGQSPGAEEQYRFSDWKARIENIKTRIREIYEQVLVSGKESEHGDLKRIYQALVNHDVRDLQEITQLLRQGLPIGYSQGAIGESTVQNPRLQDNSGERRVLGSESSSGTLTFSDDAIGTLGRPPRARANSMYAASEDSSLGNSMRRDSVNLIEGPDSNDIGFMTPTFHRDVRHPVRGWTQGASSGFDQDRRNGLARPLLTVAMISVGLFAVVGTVLYVMVSSVRRWVLKRLSRSAVMNILSLSWITSGVLFAIRVAYPIRPSGMPIAQYGI